jgi:hypothetical protein
MKNSGVRRVKAMLSECIEVLEDELSALRIWQSAKNSRGALALPDDICDGMTISIDKIEAVLRKARLGSRPELSGRGKHGKQCKE